MGLSWQQGPLSPGAIGRFLVPQPLPDRLLYVEPLRRRMRVLSAGTGSPIASTFCCSLSPAAILWPTSRRPISLRAHLKIWIMPLGTPTSELRLGTPYGQAITLRRAEHGTTPRYLPTQANWNRALRLLGEQWMLFMRKTNESWVTPLTPTTASIFARHLDIWWSAIATGLSPIQRDHWRSMNPASRPAGTFCAPTSTSPLSLRSNTAHIARIKGSAAITILGSRISRHGRILTLIRRSAGSQTWYRSNRISSAIYLDGTQIHLDAGQTVIPHRAGSRFDVPVAIGKQP